MGAAANGDGGNKKAYLNGKSTQFKKGNPGGPGTPKLPEVIQEIRKINRADVEQLFSDCFSMTIEELEIVEKDPKSTAMKMAFAKCAIAAAQKGSLVHLEAILSRLLPPLPKVKEDDTPSPFAALKAAMKEVAKQKLIDGK